jgi:hypothetical protein
VARSSKQEATERDAQAADKAEHIGEEVAARTAAYVPPGVTYHPEHYGSHGSVESHEDKAKRITAGIKART